MWVDYNLLYPYRGHLYITVNFTKIILDKIFSFEVYYMGIFQKTSPNNVKETRSIDIGKF